MALAARVAKLAGRWSIMVLL